MAATGVIGYMQRRNHKKAEAKQVCRCAENVRRSIILLHKKLLKQGEASIAFVKHGIRGYRLTPLFHGIKSFCLCLTELTSISPLATFIT